jgi:diguanylate cyclase (GGDEF)-like protein
MLGVPSMPPEPSDPNPLVRRSERRSSLATAAAASALLWLCLLAAALAGAGRVAIVAVAVAGLAGAGALAWLLGRPARMRALAGTDPLTGLRSHRGFHEELIAALDEVDSSGGRLALASLDLDSFRAINEASGHTAGDEVLREVATRIRAAVRSTDVVARIGGQEFALIMDGASNEDAHAVTERARVAVEAVAVPEETDLTCSAGIAFYPDDAQDPDTLCELAEAALHWAKRGGKRRTRRFDADRIPIEWSGRERTRVKALLAGDGEIRAAFQPIVALATGRVIGFEALARFPRSPERSPGAWFAHAHACGLGPELEAAAIRAALAPLGRPPGSTLSINVSPSSLGSGQVTEALPRDLTDLVLEVTEHEITPDDPALHSTLMDLRDRGARIAIDDTGAGYAGLNAVMRVRPDIVKLDRELITDIHEDPARMALVESFVRFASLTGATVCAEGIQSLDDLIVLTDLDVEWGQGNLLSAPAEPWATVSAVAADVCRTASRRALRARPEDQAAAAGERWLEYATAQLASAASRADLEAALTSIAAELHADKVTLSQWHPAEGVVETLAENGRFPGEERFRLTDYPLTERVLRDQAAAQVLVSDPDTDPAEVRLLLGLGHRSLLIVPVIARGETLGIVEAYSDEERPWTRAEISRARIIANQFAATIQALFRTSSSPRD